jgi:hypothetical protein
VYTIAFQEREAGRERFIELTLSCIVCAIAPVVKIPTGAGTVMSLGKKARELTSTKVKMKAKKIKSGAM